MRETGRAIRRLNRAKMKKRAVDVLKKWSYDGSALNERNIGKHADNLAICSCDMCGNPRRLWKKKTLQERRCEDTLS